MKDTRPNPDGASQRTGLGAYMSPVAMVALAFGYAVGWGAFVLPGTQFLPDAGPLGTLIGILIGTAAMSVFALNYYRLVIRRPGPGGAYGFVTKAFGADHGFLVGWFLFITYIAIMWANSTALVIMTRCVLGDVLQFGFHYTMVGFDVYFGEAIFCTAVIVLCGVLCLIGKRLAIGIHRARRRHGAGRGDVLRRRALQAPGRARLDGARVLVRRAPGGPDPAHPRDDPVGIRRLRGRGPLVG